MVCCYFKPLLVLLLIVRQLNEGLLYVVLVVFEEYDLIHRLLPIRFCFSSFKKRKFSYRTEEFCFIDVL
jgi:hypothetical protein